MDDPVMVCPKTGCNYCTVSEQYVCHNCGRVISGPHVIVCHDSDCSDSYKHHAKVVQWRLAHPDILGLPASF